MQTINELSSSEKSEPSCYQKSRSISSTEFKTNSLLANFKEHKQNNNINDIDECLGYKKIYQTKYTPSEEKEEKDSNESNKLSNSSNGHSGITQAESSLGTNTSTYQINKNEHIPIYTSTRKMSSPVCSYYNSSHKVLSELLDKNLLDYSKSNNYIEKDTFIKPTDNIYYGYIPFNQKPQRNAFRSIELYEKKEEIEETIKDSNTETNDNSSPNNTADNRPYTPTIPLKLNNPMFSIFNQRKSMMLPNSFKGENNKISFRQFQLNPPIGIQNERKKHKPFTERAGDWVCCKCKNLNFAFRTMCNRCHLQKSESDKMSETAKKTNNNNTSIKGNNN